MNCSIFQELPGILLQVAAMDKPTPCCLESGEVGEFRDLDTPPSQFQHESCHDRIADASYRMVSLRFVTWKSAGPGASTPRSARRLAGSLINGTEGAQGI